MWFTWMKAVSIAVPLVVATGRLHADVADDSQVEKVVVVQIGSDDEETGTRAVVVRTDGPTGAGCCLRGAKGGGARVLAAPGPATGDSSGLALIAGPGSGPIVQLAPLAVGVDDDGSGWLGVHLTAVPAPLSAQLDLEGVGVMVSNVVEDSPADEAGMRRWDVIVSLNGESVSADMGPLIERIRGLGEGSDVDLAVMRNGAKTDLTVTLGARPESARTRWQYEFAPDVALKERIRDRAHVLKRGEDGEFEFKNLDRLPAELHRVFPFRHGLTTRIMLDDDRKSFNVVITEGDETLEIVQDDAGEITVRRTDENGQVTESVYSSADELAAGDEEAFKIYDSMGKHHNVFILGDGTAKLDLELDLDLDELGDHLQELKLKLEDVDETALDAAMEGLHEVYKNMPRFDRDSRPHAFSWRHSDEDDGEPGAWGRWFGAHAGPAGYRFRVAPDNSIEVIVRDGDTEVIHVFQDEGDLAARNPTLHQKYENAQKALP